MFESDMDAEDREGSVTVSTGMLLLLGALLAIHFGGIRFSSGVEAGLKL
jgi:hypothetical protein